MLTLASYSNTSFTATFWGGVSNCFIISELTFEDIEISACSPFKGLRAEVLYIHIFNKPATNDNEMTNKEQQPIYVSPQVKTIEIEAQAMICQSNYNTDTYPEENQLP